MKRWTPLLAVVLVLAMSAAVLACPLCKDSVANNDSPSAADLPGGFNLSIYYMLGALFGVMGMLGMIFYKATRTSPQPPPATQLP